MSDNKIENKTENQTETVQDEFVVLETKQAAPDIVFVLDESGSMDVMGKEPVQSLNLFLNDQKSNPEDSTYSIYTFNTKVRCVVKDRKVSEAVEFTEYSPGGGTALYDAISQAVKDKLETGRIKNTVLVIITDGQNNSGETTKKTAMNLIKEQKEKNNWQVIFLAANQDAFAEGGSLGLSSATCAGFSSRERGNLYAQMSNASQAVKGFRSSSCSSSSSAACSIDLHKKSK